MPLLRRGAAQRSAGQDLAARCDRVHVLIATSATAVGAIPVTVTPARCPAAWDSTGAGEPPDHDDGGHAFHRDEGGRAAVLITDPRRMSPFVIELLNDPHVTVARTGDAPVEICPGCGHGRLVRRNGRFGPFLGCPACTYTRDR